MTMSLRRQSIVIPETSVIINETTTIKLIELNKKNNDNVFATAIYRHSNFSL